MGWTNAKSALIKREYSIQTPYKTEDDKTIQYLERDEIYEYLGYQQKRNVEHKIIKNMLTEKYRQIMSTSNT